MAKVENFTPIASLIGGILIGLSASAMLLWMGRIAGISGIVGGIVSWQRNDVLWRIAFVGGLLAGGFIVRLIAPQLLQVEIVRSTGVLILGGVMVGVGARLGNGCTSGHGVCGIGRLSRRSIVATVIFIVVGAAAVYVVNHFLGGAI
jgi:uncharacterized membrane protein YedE/YeeE